MASPWDTVTETLSRLTQPIRSWGRGVVSDYVVPPAQKPISPVPQQQLAEQRGFISPISRQPEPPPPPPPPPPQPNFQYAEQGIPFFTPEEFVNPIDIAASQYNINPALLAELFKKESINFNPYYVSGPGTSPVGAMGMGQFMPIALEELMRLGYNQGQRIDPYNPEQAIPASAFFLNHLLGQTGNMRDALAGYNAGLGNLEGGYGYADDLINALIGQ